MKLILDILSACIWKVHRPDLSRKIEYLGIYFRADKMRSGFAFVLAGVFIAAAFSGCVFGIGENDAGTEPEFEYRGMIEGFYGTPWSHDAKMSMFPWMGEHGLNIYIHAPKDDPYQRANWRDPYPEEELAEYLEEVKAATAAGVNWVPNISPGVALIPGTPEIPSVPSTDICFTSDTDFAILISKLDPFIDAGSKVAMISFDDAIETSTHPEDIAKYGGGIGIGVAMQEQFSSGPYGNMNRDLLNRIYRHYAANISGFCLMTVLAEYSGVIDSAYLQGIRADGGLDAGIEIMWTGMATVAPTIACDNASVYAKNVGREKILIWDNYPVNDYAVNKAGIAMRLFMGPYQGRASDLPTCVSGILSNPMNEAFCNRIAVGTFADYMNDPVNYNPESSWRNAITEMAGGDAILEDALLVFCENSRGSTLNRTESPAFVEASSRLLAGIDAGPFWTNARDGMLAEIAREKAAPEKLRAVPEILSEASGFIDRLEANVKVIEAGTNVLLAQKPSLEAKIVNNSGFLTVEGKASGPSYPSVMALFVEIEANQAATMPMLQSMHGDRFLFDTGNVYYNENLVDAFYSEINSRTMSWAPNSPMAMTGVTVTVNGEEVALDAEGKFSAELGNYGFAEIIATDGAGGQIGAILYS